jgi:hypothetical protein
MRDIGAFFVHATGHEDMCGLTLAARSRLVGRTWGMNRMIRKFLLLLAVAICPVAIGCSMCQSCLDYEYGAYGGVCTDASCGSRAGSRFTSNSSYYEPVAETAEIE